MKGEVSHRNLTLLGVLATFIVGVVTLTGIDNTVKIIIIAITAILTIGIGVSELVIRKTELATGAIALGNSNVKAGNVKKSITYIVVGGLLLHKPFGRIQIVLEIIRDLQPGYLRYRIDGFGRVPLVHNLCVFYRMENISTGSKSEGAMLLYFNQDDYYSGFAAIWDQQNEDYLMGTLQLYPKGWGDKALLAGPLL